jgi:hypothetical protein
MAHHAAAQTASLTPQEVTVTGNPFGHTERAAITSQLQGDDLTLGAKYTLGEALDGLPGVSSTTLAPTRAGPSSVGWTAIAPARCKTAVPVWTRPA